jgi:Na+-driven multidrug efflux pump
MLVSMLAMGVNALCNYVLIFGKLGFPALGVEGAAIGTLIARVVEMCIYLVMLGRKKTIFSLDLSKPIELNIHAEEGSDAVIEALKPYIV